MIHPARICTAGINVQLWSRISECVMSILPCRRAAIVDDFDLICLRNRRKFTLPDSHQAASSGGWCDGAGILGGPVERSRGVAVQSVTRHIFQQLLFHRSTHWYQKLQTGEVHFGKEGNAHLGRFPVETSRGKSTSMMRRIQLTC